MSKDEIISLAREAGIFVPIAETHALGAMTIKTLEDFAALVADREREACAMVCEANRNVVAVSHPARIEFAPDNMMALKCAAAIRSRSTD